MKKTTPTSISVVVTSAPEFRIGIGAHSIERKKYYWGGGINEKDVLKTFPKTPKPPYKLTYLLSEKGKIQVLDGRKIPKNRGWDCISPAVCKNGKYLPTCFMRRSWIGKTVIREVEKIKI